MTTGCWSGKVTYRTHRAALLVLERARSVRLKYDAHSHRREVAAYRCRYCGGWHLTSKPQREGRRHARSLLAQEAVRTLGR